MSNEQRIAILEAAIRYALDLIANGFVDEAVGELDRAVSQ